MKVSNYKNEFEDKIVLERLELDSIVAHGVNVEVCPWNLILWTTFFLHHFEMKKEKKIRDV